jgi:TolA-binding protein
VAEVEFELQTSKEAKDKQFKGDELLRLLEEQTRNTWAGLIVSGMHFWPMGQNFDPAGPAYWAWWISRVQEVRKARAARQKFDGTAPFAPFADRLAELNEKAVPLEKLDAVLAKNPEGQPALLKFFAFNFDDGYLDEQPTPHGRFFSLEKLLSQLKAMEAKNQKHYRLTLSVVATDNNVETGPVSTPSVTSYTFLVVSESELMTQIYQQQDELREQLEKVLKRLEDGKTAINDGIARLTASQPELEVVAIRLDETRKAVQEGSTGTRDLYTAFRRILREMKVNRIQGKEVKRIDEEVCRPLEEATSTNDGLFMKTEELLQKAALGVEEDLSAQQKGALKELAGDRKEAHLQGANQARAQLDELMKTLNRVLGSLQDIENDAKTVEKLVQIEREHRRQTQRLQTHLEELRAALLNDITAGDSKEKSEPKEK